MDIESSEASETTVARPWPFVEILVKLSGCAVFATAFFALFGYSVANSYFQSLGVPWAIDMVSTNVLLLWGLPLVGWFLVPILYGVRYGRNAKRTTRFNRFMLAGFLIAICGSIVMALTKDGRFAYWSGRAFIAGYALAAGGASAEVTQALMNGKKLAAQWSTIESFAIFILFLAPPNYAQMLARLDADPTSSPLAIAIVEGHEGDQWRLVKTFGEKALLMKPAANEADRQFTVVATDKLRMRFTKF